MTSPKRSLELCGCWSCVYDIELINPALVFSRGGRAGDSPRLQGSEWGSPPGQGGALQAETNKRPTDEVGFGLIGTLSRRGARYPGKKARSRFRVQARGARTAAALRSLG